MFELGGQDAKIIIFKKNEETGGKTAITSMNDKCASGTGATIDKCVIKVGLPAEELVKIGFDDSKLHHVAAKCGVFAETDIVNLVKSGIPSLEIMNSLADAIVMQNLSVLTRGNTLRHKVLLLGGPNTYLPFLRDCWRKRIPETWRERGYAYPKDVPIEELIIVPENAQYYAAFGAVDVRPATRTAEVGVYKGIDGLKRLHHSTGARRASARPRARRSAQATTAGGARRVPRALHDPEVHGRDVRARAGRARRHRPGRRLDVVEGRADRRRHGRAAQEGVPALEGQPDRRHQGDPGAACKKYVTDQGASSR